MKKFILFFGVLLLFLPTVFASAEIYVTSPVNESSTGNDFVEVNVSTNVDTNDMTDFIWNWNGTNYSIMDSGLIVNYGFNNLSSLGENNTLIVDASGNYNGTPYDASGVTLGEANYQAGKYGLGVDLDGVGENIAVVPCCSNQGVIDGFAQGTISIWIKPRAYVSTNSGEYSIIWANPTSTDTWLIFNSNNAVTFRINTDLDSSTVIPLNEWTHIVTVWNTTGRYIYIDGVLDTTGSANSVQSGYNYGFAIGNNGYPDYHFEYNGVVDAFRIFDYSITPEQVYALYATDLARLSPSNWSFYVNQSMNATNGLSNGVYNFEAFINSAVYNWNSTGQYEITVGAGEVTDTTPPNGVTLLNATHIQNSSINWTWVNPVDVDFNNTILYLNGSNVANLSNTTTSYNSTGLSCGVDYNMTIHTMDNSSNINTTDITNISATLACIDLTPPASVTLLNATIIQNSSINWTWVNPTDVDFNNTILYLNGSNVANLSNETTSYNSTGLSCGIDYNMTVHTMDNSSNINTTDVTNISATLSCPDTIPPASITGLTNTSSTNNSIQVNWTNPVDVDFDEAIVYLNGSNIVNTSSTGTNATGLSCNTVYNFTIHTKDTTGNVNDTNVEDLFTTKACPDVTPPASVTGLTNTSSGLTSIQLNWSNPTDIDFNASIVYRNGSNIVNVSSPINGTNVTGLSCGTVYNFTVHTKDATGNVNDSNVEDLFATVDCIDSVPPASVTLLNATHIQNSSINWTWVNPVDADFDSSILFLNGTNLVNTSITSYNTTGLSCGLEYNLTVHTKDTSGNVNTSDVTNLSFTLTCNDLIPPASVTLLNATIIQNSSINWTWVNPTDVDFNNTVLYLNGSNVANLSNETTSYNSTGLSCGVDYNMTIHTMDNSSNVNTSDVTNISATLACPVDSSPPASISNLANHSSLYSINWTWVNPVDADFNVSILYLNGSNSVNTSNTSYNFTGLSCGLEYNLTIHTRDHTGNVNTSDVTNVSATLACLDTTPPASITGLTNTSSGNTSILLNWSNPVDVDFNASIIYRNGSNIINVSTPGTGYNVTGLSCGTLYNFTVHTKDATGNVNDSNVEDLFVTVTCPVDSTPPGTISGLTNFSGYNSINWSWSNPVDADFSQAILYLNGSNDVNTSDSSYNFTGLSCGLEYNLTVHTKDANGNVNDSDVFNLSSTLACSDLTPPTSVSSLQATQILNYSINWNWSNPVDADFNASILYLDGVNVINLSNSSHSYNSTGLSCGTSYNLTVHTKDHSGNINTSDVTNISATLSCPSTPSVPSGTHTWGVQPETVVFVPANITCLNQYRVCGGDLCRKCDWWDNLVTWFRDFMVEASPLLNESYLLLDNKTDEFWEGIQE